MESNKGNAENEHSKLQGSRFRSLATVEDEEEKKTTLKALVNSGAAENVTPVYNELVRKDTTQASSNLEETTR